MSRAHRVAIVRGRDVEESERRRSWVVEVRRARKRRRGMTSSCRGELGG